MFEQVLVGRSLGTADLGQYRYAYRIASMPSLAVIQVCGYVLFPAFSRISGDGARFREAFLRALGWIWFAAASDRSAVGCSRASRSWCCCSARNGAPPGRPPPRWRESGWARRSLSVGWEAIKGAGRSSLLNWLTVLGLVLGVGLIVLLLPFGLVGVGIAISVTYLVVGFVTVELARSVVDASFRDIVARLAPSTLSALLAFAVVFPLERLFVRSDQYIVPLGLASVVAECLLFALVYLGVLRLVSPTRYRSVRDVAERAVSEASWPGSAARCE